MKTAEQKERRPTYECDIHERGSGCQATFQRVEQVTYFPLGNGEIFRVTNVKLVPYIITHRKPRLEDFI